MCIFKKIFQHKQTYDVFLIFSLLLFFHLLLEISFADSGGHFILPELNGTITIDNEDAPTTCSDVDWPGAGDFLDISITPVTTGNIGTGKFLIYHPEDPLAEEELYVFFSINDNSPDVSVNIDNLVLMFDLSHDHAVVGASSFIESDDRGIRFNRNDSVQRVYGDIINPQVDTDPTVFPDSRACISELDSTDWLIEAKILPSDIGLNSFNDLVGIAVLAEDRTSGSSSYSRWPGTVIADPNTWANMVTRSPIDFVMLIDQSGSMSGDKWTSAKQAGNNFRALLSILHDSELANEYSAGHLGVSGGGDRLGLATFSTSLAGYAHTNGSLTSIDATASDYTGLLPASPGGGTPMVAGINETFDVFGGATHLSDPALTNPNIIRQKVVMLLSDGKHNTPSTTMDFDTEDSSDITGDRFRYLATTPDCDLNTATNSLVRINTVAVGTDSTVDTDKLDDIKGCFSGSRMTNIYTSVGATGPARTAELSRFYFQTVYPYYHLNMINDTGANFTINDGERKLILFAFWPDTSSVTSLSVTNPSSSVENGTCESSLGFCYLVVDNPEEGTWTNFSAPGAVANGKYVLLDLRVEAKFAIDNQPHGTSSDITLKARLREDGKPITGATVRVETARPEEGFGTFASTHSLDGCDVIQPSLPPIDPDIRARMKSDISSKNLIKLIPASNAETVPQGTTGGDINPPSFALMQQLLQTCGKADLDRTTDAGLTLYDDGSHGDEVVNDGIYTLVFTNTSI
ncbi:MAG: VWA domain-containing protein, partial [Desulfobacteraceae bacterium]